MHFLTHFRLVVLSLCISRSCCIVITTGKTSSVSILPQCTYRVTLTTNQCLNAMELRKLDCLLPILTPPLRLFRVLDFAAVLPFLLMSVR